MAPPASRRSHPTNQNLHDLLVAFKARTGYGVLCNTSLNFKGKGLINNIDDLDAYTVQHGLDGFVVEGRAYLLKSSQRYQAYLEANPPFPASRRRSRTAALRLDTRVARLMPSRSEPQV